MLSFVPHRSARSAPAPRAARRAKVAALAAAALLAAAGLATGPAAAQQSGSQLGGWGTAPQQQAMPTPQPNAGGGGQMPPMTLGNQGAGGGAGGMGQAQQQQPMAPQPTPVFSASQPQVLSTYLQDRGYRALLETDSQGDPVIRSSAAGVDFSIYFYGCDGGQNCTTISFSAGFDLIDGTTAEVMNEWNRANRFAYAYIDDEGDPFLNYDVTFADGGLPPATFGSAIDIWDARLSDFLQHIDW